MEQIVESLLEIIDRSEEINIVYEACYDGNIKLLEYLRSIDYDLDSAVGYAIGHHNINILEYLHKNDIGNWEDSLKRAIESNSIEIIEWLERNRSLVLSIGDLNTALYESNSKTIRWLFDNRKFEGKLSVINIAYNLQIDQPLVDYILSKRDDIHIDSELLKHCIRFNLPLFDYFTTRYPDLRLSDDDIDKLFRDDMIRESRTEFLKSRGYQIPEHIITRILGPTGATGPNN